MYCRRTRGLLSYSSLSANGRGRIVAEEVYKSIHGTVLHDKIVIVGTDRIASMIGRYNGFIQSLEEHLMKLLQWCVCTLHANELPLRHVFSELDGTASSPNSFFWTNRQCVGWSCL